ncbi:hypothetical protein [Arabiibacter massiliensis]|uniref:hypothetical protein n=1 Tax=Arabiibacter massiliensis TaxID=1870985 RepID=UPI001E5F6454|nr:hypothetical protein [Arabiibacter massiliensis]
MNATRNRTARAFAGGACIAIAACALAWFALQFLPGEPREHVVDTEVGRGQASSASRYDAESIVDVRVGEEIRLEGLTGGKGFAYSEEEIASWSAEERANNMGADSWRYDLPTLGVSVVGLRTVTEDAFAEWYPHYGEAAVAFGDAERKAFLAELTVTNPGDEPARIPTFQLWSEDFEGASDKLGSGIFVDKYLTDELYGEPQDGFTTFTLPDGWNVLKPGETRSWTVPFLVYANSFRDRSAYDDIDPARFCLAVADYDPPTIYRLWLG